MALNFSPDVICLSETRLKNQPLINIDLPHYKFVHVNVTNCAAGGMAIYVSDKYQFQLCRVQYELTSSECLWLEVSEVNNNKSKYIVGVVYCHPTQTTVNDFLNGFSNCLTHLSNSKESYYILGDFNINLCPVRRLPSANDYINMTIGNGTILLITKPTRVAKTLSTILDHIITNNFELSLNPAVIETILPITTLFSVQSENLSPKLILRWKLNTSETSLLFLPTHSVKIYTKVCLIRSLINHPSP